MEHHIPLLLPGLMFFTAEEAEARQSVSQRELPPFPRFISSGRERVPRSAIILRVPPPGETLRLLLPRLGVRSRRVLSEAQEPPIPPLNTQHSSLITSPRPDTRLQSPARAI